MIQTRWIALRTVRNGDKKNSFLLVGKTQSYAGDWPTAAGCPVSNPGKKCANGIFTNRPSRGLLFTSTQLYMRSLKMLYPIWSVWLSTSRYEMMMKCWAESPEDRPNISDLIEQLKNVLDMQMVGELWESILSQRLMGGWGCWLIPDFHYTEQMRPESDHQQAQYICFNPEHTWASCLLVISHSLWPLRTKIPSFELMTGNSFGSRDCNHKPPARQCIFSHFLLEVIWIFNTHDHHLLLPANNESDGWHATRYLVDVPNYPKVDAS